MNTLEIIALRYHINLHGKSPIEIPNIGRDELANLFRELGYEFGAEIGVMKGEYSKVLLDAIPDLFLYSIDSWTAVPGREFNAQGWNQKILDGFHDAAIKRLEGYKNCEIVNLSSMDAIKEFEDNYLDFVYIDASHTFQDCTNDIVEWSKKVRPGGIISGHDYARFAPHKEIDTFYVVNAYTQARGIKPWFLAGRMEKNPGEIRDQLRSWFWVKQ